MEQRYAIWTIVRIIHAMVQRNRYTEVVTESLPDIYHPSGAGTEVGKDDLSFGSIDLYGTPFSMSDALMASIIAIVKLFETLPHKGARVQAFVGRWRNSPYRLVAAWWTKDDPS